MAPCDIFLYQSIINSLNKNYIIINTLRNHAETISLANDNKINAEIIGDHQVGSIISQLSSFSNRCFNLLLRVPKFDVSISLANLYAIFVSKVRFSKSISIIDNDLIEYNRTPLERVASYFHTIPTNIMAPKSYPINLTIKNGANPDKIITFNGFKEDIYVSDYRPNNNFLDYLPFKEYIVVRPEALYSTYIHHKMSIVPSLLKLFQKENYNVIYLPRHTSDLAYLKQLSSDNIWVPKKALNGLDLAFYAIATTTGSGTFAREAACMSKTAVSFFPDKLLAVDKSLIDQKRLFHSRLPEEIMRYIIDNKNKQADLNRSKLVKKEFMAKLNQLLDDI